MQSISVYDIEANKIEKLCDRYDLTEPEIDCFAPLAISSRWH